MAVNCLEFLPLRGKASNGYQWLISVILAIWEAELGRIPVPGRPGQKPPAISAMVGSLK
jgi:hypothetical protein